MLRLLPLLLLAGCVQQPDAAGGVAMAAGYRGVTTTYVADGTPTMSRQACGQAGDLHAFTSTNGAGLVCVFANHRVAIIAQTGPIDTARTSQ